MRQKRYGSNNCPKLFSVAGTHGQHTLLAGATLALPSFRTFFTFACVLLFFLFPTSSSLSVLFSLKYGYTQHFDNDYHLNSAQTTQHGISKVPITSHKTWWAGELATVCPTSHNCFYSISSQGTAMENHVFQNTSPCQLSVPKLQLNSRGWDLSRFSVRILGSFQMIQIPLIKECLSTAYNQKYDNYLPITANSVQNGQALKQFWLDLCVIKSVPLV